MTELLQRVLAYVLSAFVNTRTINQNRPRVISSNPGETARRNHQIGESSLQAAIRVIFQKANQLIRKNESGLYLEPL